jgi:predicted permease
LAAGTFWENIARIIPSVGWIIFMMLLFNTVNNVVAAITGTSPTATITTNLAQTIVPVIIQLMPIMMIMGMMRSIMMSFTGGFTW